MCVFIVERMKVLLFMLSFGSVIKGKRYLEESFIVCLECCRLNIIRLFFFKSLKNVYKLVLRVYFIIG